VRRLSLLLSLLLLSAAGAHAAPDAADRNRIVAVVNNDVITQAELHRALVPVYLQMQATMGPEDLAKQLDDMKKKVLDQLIDERLMLQEARSPRPVEVGKGKIGTPPVIEVTEAEVDELLQDTQKRFSTPEEFEGALQEQNLTVEDLRLRFKDQISIQKLIAREIRSRLDVSPSEITAYYEARKKEFVTPEAVQVAVILIRPKDNLDVSRAYSQAKDLHRQLGQGADFYDLARRFSDGFNPTMGGRIGMLEKGKNRKEIDSVLFDLRAGQISPVIKTPSGFHIFLIESARPSRQAELSEVQDEIENRLLQEKGSVRYSNWIAKLRADSYISVK
jgi:parvulin-like peptidyl-prolyl isomerase